MGVFVLVLIISGSILGYLFLGAFTHHALAARLKYSKFERDTDIALEWLGAIFWPLVLPTLVVVWVLVRIDRGAGWLYRLLTGGS